VAFDLTGAPYSQVSVGDPPAGWMPAAIGLALVTGSYIACRAQSNDNATPGAHDAATHVYKEHEL
jgi:hypothetical protein